MERPVFLSVIVPVYNEVGTIADMIRRVRAVPISKEIVVIEDGSTDGTRQALEAIAKEAPGGTLTVLFHSRNRGKGAAIQTAVPHVKGEVAVIQDADLELDPEEYDRLLAPIREGRADVVYGSRFLGKRPRELRFLNRLGNQVMTRLCNRALGLKLSDMETGHKLFRTEILRRMPIRSSRFGFEPEVTVKLAQMRQRICEVPISYHARDYAHGKKLTWFDGLEAIWTLLRFACFPDLGDDRKR